MPTVIPGNPTRVPIPSPTSPPTTTRPTFKPTLAPTWAPTMVPSPTPTSAPTLMQCWKMEFDPPPEVAAAEFSNTGAMVLLDLGMPSDQAGMDAGVPFSCDDILEFDDVHGGAGVTSLKIG